MKVPGSSPWVQRSRTAPWAAAEPATVSESTLVTADPRSITRVNEPRAAGAVMAAARMLCTSPGSLPPAMYTRPFQAAAAKSSLPLASGRASAQAVTVPSSLTASESVLADEPFPPSTRR